MIRIVILLSLAGYIYGQTFIGRPLKPLNSDCLDYTTANTATMVAGGSQYIYRGSNLAGVTDGKQYTCSVWVKPAVASNGSIRSLFEIDTGGGAFRVRLYKESSDEITFVARNAAGTTIVQGANTNKVVSTSGIWYHVFVSVDLTDTGKRHLMINGADCRVSDWITYTNDDMDILASQQNVGSNPSATEQYQGAYSELWVDDVYVADVTKFRCASSGRPVDLGATGSVPTGSVPAIYLSRNGSANAWATDSSGNGNDFSLQNALGSTTSP